MERDAEVWASFNLSIKPEDNDVTENDDPQLCRLCAKSVGPMLYIFGDSKDTQELAYKINTFLPIKVKKSDLLPKQVCMSCISHLEMISEYAEFCMKAEDQLKSRIKAERFRSQRVVPARVSSPVPAGPDSETCCFACPLCSAGSMRLHRDPDSSSDSSSGEGCGRFTKPTTSNVETCSNIDNCSDVTVTKLISSNMENCTSNTVKKITASYMEGCNNITVTKLMSSNMVSDSNNTSTKLTASNVEGCGNNTVTKLLVPNKGNSGNTKFTVPNKGSINKQVITQLIIPDMLTDADLTALETANYCIDILEAEDVEVPYTGMDNGESYFPAQILGQGKENVNPIMNDHEDIKPCTSRQQNVPCQLCGQQFTSEGQCLEHSMCHVEMSKYPCSVCGLQFATNEEWMDHSKDHMHDTDRQYLCGGCDELFDSYTAFSTHVCSTKRTYKCTDCDTDFISEIRLIFHRNYAHGVVPLSCVLCKKEIPTTSEYFLHMKTVHSESNVEFCQLCGKQFSSTSQFMTHVRTVHEEYYNVRPYTCKICGKQFHNKQILQGHYVTHMEVKPFKCEFCGMMLARKNSLRQHLLSHHAKSFPPQACYQCNTCNEAFTTLNQAVAHTDTHASASMPHVGHELQNITVSQLYLCEYCENCYTVKSALTEHRQIHKSDNLYLCKVCKATFSTYGRASKHRLIHLRSESESNFTEEFTVSKLFVCEECDKCFPHWTSICHHRRNQHQNIPTYTCKICNETFKKFSEYQEHRRHHSTEVKQEPNKESNGFKCDFCGKSFGHRSTLVLHQRIHTGRQPHACKICGDKFRLKSMYEKHVSKHTGTKPYVCEVCGKGFTQNSGLYTHRRVHTGEKPYPCDMCDKHFRLKHDRDNHRRCHTGERPYRCMYCGKAFRTSHDHRQHQLIHTGQRPYPCHYCGKGFRRINALNVHKRIHTGERPYGCELCGRYFTQKGDMMKHRKTQHDIKLDEQ